MKSSAEKEIESSEIKEVVEEELVLENTEEMDSKSVHQENIQPASGAENKRNNKGLVFVLISAFIVIAAISTYYLFLNDSIEYDKSEVSSSIDETATELPDEDIVFQEKLANELLSLISRKKSSL